VSIAVLGFFVLAGVGWLCEVPVFVCATRAAIGAAVLFVMTMVAGKTLLNIMVDAMIRGRSRQGEMKETSGERRSE
jgi:hypothetical protein